MYKLIALDMDGTLLNEEKVISNRCKQAIHAAKEKGVHVVLATGRPLNGITRFIDELDLKGPNDYAVAFNGALVQQTASQEIIFNRPLSLACYLELFQLSLDLGVNIHALTDNRILTPKNNPYTEIEAKLNQLPIIESPVSEVLPNTNIVKVMFIDDPEHIDSILPRISKEIHEKYAIVRSAPFFLEFLDKEVGKGKGVSAVADKLGIHVGEVICVGDAENDLDMIHYASLGIAMGNAAQEIKDAAQYVTYANTEDGVAHVIEKFILNK